MLLLYVLQIGLADIGGVLLGVSLFFKGLPSH